jgi:hypothetical protein
MLVNRFAAVTAACLTTLAASPALAVSVPGSCSVEQAGGVTENVGCYKNLTVNNVDKSVLDDDAVFGISDWTFIGKSEFGGSYEFGDGFGGDDFSLSSGFTVQSGQFTVDSGLFATFDILTVVLKSGSGNSGGKKSSGQEGGIFAYALKPGEASYDYASVFETKSGFRALSNISLYGGGEPGGSGVNEAPVPLPATGWLMLAVIGAGGFAARMRRRQS